MFYRLKNILRLFYNLFKYDISINEYFNKVLESRISCKAKFLGSHHIYKSTIEDYTYIAQNAHISYTSIGKYCSIGPNLVCGWGIHPIHGVSTSPMFYSNMKQNGYSVCKENKIDERKDITIGNDVFIGANVVILDGITIGDGAVIGAGTVVSKNIPPYAVVVGCPIKILKYRFDELTIQKMQKLNWWNKKQNVHNLIEKNFFDVERFMQEIDEC